MKKTIIVIISTFLLSATLWIAGLVFLPHEYSAYLLFIPTRERDDLLRSYKKIDQCWEVAKHKQVAFENCLAKRGLASAYR